MKRLTQRTRLVVAGMAIVAALGAWGWKTTQQVKPLDTKRVDLGNGVTMDFVWIPPGEFMMGSPTNEVGRLDNETQHRVKITKGFWMGKYEVTQKQFTAVMGTNPSVFDLGGNYPVDGVSWEDAVAFCAKVKERTGLEMRLPTEAEWEYACRAGTTTAYYTGDTEADLAQAGCFIGNAWRGFKIWKWNRRRWGPRPVGWYEPNNWGLYDMHGNVSEWCVDWYVVDSVGAIQNAIHVGPWLTGPVVRGGVWDGVGGACRSAARGWSDSWFRLHNTGFRVCLDAN